MSWLGHRRSRFSTPKKGTKARSALIAMAHAPGLTLKEATACFGMEKGTFSGVLENARSLGGWDIRGFRVPNPEPERPGRHRHLTAYRIVGRERWREGYRDLSGLLEKLSDER